MSDLLQVTDQNFSSEVLEAKEPVLVDFWAEWCGPCRAIAPIVEEIAKDYDGRLKVAKLNVDDNPQTAQNYRVMSIPTLLLFKEGKIVDQMIGAVPKERLTSFLDKHL